MNPKVTLVEHRPDYQAIYGLNLYVYLGLDVQLASTVREVIEQLEESETSLIFVDNRAYTTDIAHDIQLELEKSNTGTPLYILGKTEVPPSVANVFDVNMELRHILQTIAKKFKITAKSMADTQVPEYFPLPLEFVVPGWFCSVPVFLKKHEHQMEIVFNSEDVISCDTMDQLEGKEVDFLFVKRDMRLKLVNSLTGQIVAKLNDPDLSPEERHTTTATGFQMVMEQARRLGINESTLDIANACIESMSKVVDAVPHLETLVTDLFSASMSYRYRHSLLICFIGSHIIRKMDWGSTEQQNKLAFIAFFHDILLYKDEYHQYKSDEDINVSNLSDKEKDLVKSHALLAAKIVSKIQKAPLGADVIIKQHHGSKSGDSLSTFASDISPLALVFMVAEELADTLIKNETSEERLNREVILMRLEQQFKSRAFEKIVPTLGTLRF